MMKRWKLILFLLVAAIIAVAFYRRTVSVCPLPLRPYPSHTFEEIPIDGWYAPACAIHANGKGEMVYESYGSEYHYTSNAVTGVVTIERWRK